MQSSSSYSSASFRMLSIILVFIFAGAIVGETVTLSIIVSVAGSSILSKLYLINGLLLFLLPAVFFKNIDRINRGKLLSYLLLGTAVILGVVFTIYAFAGISTGARTLRSYAWLIYPLSYLSKTVLFLTFWTLANDICQRGEAKKIFPRVAAWGFIGGLGGAWIARMLLNIVEAETIILVWAAAYLIASAFTNKLTKMNKIQLLHKEQISDGIPGTRQLGAMLGEVREVLDIDLVRLISVLYFLVFVAVFSLDYLFWHTCHQWFSTPRSLASFQFSFYIAHSIITVLCLQLVMPSLISRWGFPRIFSFLPIVLFVGSCMLVGMPFMGRFGEKTIFMWLIGLQFARYVTFENAFSPIYQMFFASISKEKRGRAKTILEGVIKPSAIIFAGVILIILRNHPQTILVMVLVVAAAMIWVVGKVRVTYMRGLMPQLSSTDEPSDIISEIGSHYDLKILSLMKDYSRSEDTDLRALAVKILAHLGSRQALTIISEIYRQEQQDSVKEMVARSLTNFYWHETKTLVEALLCDPNPRIRSNTIYSLNAMNCNWKLRLKDMIKSMMNDSSIRVRIEAAGYLWKTGEQTERGAVMSYMTSLCNSQNINKRSAGLYLVGMLKADGWERQLLDNLTSSSFQVFSRCIDVIFASATLNVRLKTLRIVQEMSRAHIALTGSVLQRKGMAVKDALVAFLPEAKNRRMLFEIVHVLRVLLDSHGRKGKGSFLDAKTEMLLYEWILGELECAYRDGFIWQGYRVKNWPSRGLPQMRILDDALRERMIHIAGWALDALVLLEGDKGLAWQKRDFDINDSADKLDIIEILENYGANKIASLVVPVLRSDSWEWIAQVGKNTFGYTQENLGDDVKCFLRSENKWVCLCALCCLGRLSGIESLRATIPDMLATFAQDEYVHLARLARELLEEPTQELQPMQSTFELLETVLFFKKTLLFRNVPAEKLMALAEVSKSVSYTRDTLISREGDISEHLYVVRSGSLKIVKVKNGVRTILSIIRQGEAYGEIGLLNQAPRSASAIANEDCELLVVQRKALKKLLMEMPEIAYNFLEIFSEKLRRSGEEVALLQTTLSGRIMQDALAGKS